MQGDSAVLPAAAPVLLDGDQSDSEPFCLKNRDPRSLNGATLSIMPSDISSRTRSMPTIWVLTDDRVGSSNQSLAVADALALPYRTVALEYGASAWLHNAIRRRSLIGIGERSREVLQPPWPDLIIASGRRTVPVSLYIKHQTGRRTRIVQIMDPGWRRHRFDLVFVPRHDGLPPAANVVPITGAPHRVTPERLEREGRLWAPRLYHLPRPRIAMLVGGPSGSLDFGGDEAHALAAAATRLVAGACGSLLVTTSRRTGATVTGILFDALPEPAFKHGWTPDGENPYVGLLASADAVIATGDSVSMLSEAAGTGKPLYIFAPPAWVDTTQGRFHRELYAMGIARPLDASHLDLRSHPPFNPADEMAAHIRTLLQRPPMRS
jgi:uncharacterized protein